MALEHTLHDKLLGLLWLALLTATTVGGSPKEDYDATHDDKLETPTQQQTEQALKAGEKFQYQLIPALPEKPPMAAIPESYTAVTELYPAHPPTEVDYDYYWWRWGARDYWPCERHDFFERHSINYSGGKHTERDHENRQDIFDMWCPPAYGPVQKYPHLRGKP